MPDDGININGFSGSLGRINTSYSDRELPRTELTFTMPDGSTMMLSGIAFSQSVQPISIDSMLPEVPSVPKKKRVKKTKPTKPPEKKKDLWELL